MGFFRGSLFSEGLIIGRNFAFQSGLGLTIETTNSNSPWAYIRNFTLIDFTSRYTPSQDVKRKYTLLTSSYTPSGEVTHRQKDITSSFTPSTDVTSSYKLSEDVTNRYKPSEDVTSSYTPLKDVTSSYISSQRRYK